MQPLSTFSTIVKLGKKGQLTLPKKLRDFDHLEEDDAFIVNRLPGGDIMLKKQTTSTPEDMLLEAIKRMKRFDANKAWEEVLAERRSEERQRNLR